METVIFFLVLVIIAAGIVYYLIQRNKAIKARFEKIKSDYQNALQSGDKQKALELGRIYYASLRDDQLAMIDEQSLTNDIATMK